MSCPTQSAHDFVVTKMYSDRNHRCFYHVACAKCGIQDSGNHDEIPPARFDTTVAKELLGDA